MTIQTYAYYNNAYFLTPVTAITPGSTDYDPVLCDSVNNGQAFDDSDIVDIPDPALRQKVRTVINKPTGTIYYEDVKNVQTLSVFFSSVQSLVGLQFFTGLDSLDLFTNNITDITLYKI